MRRIPARRPSPPPTSTPGRSRWWGWRRAWALTASTALGLAAIGCGSDGPDTPSATLPAVTTVKADATTEPAPTSTTVAPTVEEQVEAAYLSIMSTYFRRLTKPDLGDPTIERNHVGASREQVRAELRRYADAGRAARLTNGDAPLPDVRTISIDGSAATLESCIVDDVQLVELSTGRVVDSDVVSKLFRATLVRGANSTWQLQSQERLERWEDGGGCDR